MYSWSIAVVFLFQRVSASSESYYECGQHGKFEYCLSRQPGCVVGCHCHPGYYFDTDTKICEPNLKLTQFRRRFDLEPTRIPFMNVETMTFPTVTTLNPIDEKVEEIAKDTDDLGDWLYNQFFKTVESQVINKTNSEKLNTRRSGNSPPVTKKRSHKKSKKTKKKKHTVRKGLRNKLLRITEDDSLFDSSSSESDTSSSSGGSSDSSDDHDHRKIVMINKKPPPPLPSFIFLPNVDTPFYPPIGLPAPPIVPPMYPMVPVPPVGMMLPWTTESVASKSETPSTTTSSTTVTSTTTTTPSSVIDENNNPALRNNPPGRHNKFQQNSPNKNMDFENKMLKKIHAKMRKKKKNRPHPSNELEALGPVFNDIPVDKSSEYHLQSMGEIPKQEDVDFKYLSQLIHKVDLNKTVPSFMTDTAPTYGDAFSGLTRKSNYQNSASIYPYNLPNNVNNIPKTLIPTSHKQRPVSKADDMTDSYFTNLGKQIASLIRKINSNGMEQQIDIEIQHQNTPNSIQATNILSEHRFSQGRSYWERFVRSPLNTLSIFKRKDAHVISNDNLVSIENQVNVATAIARPFSLDELENMANIMEQANLKQESIQYHPAQRTTTMNNQYKFNLLPQINRQINDPVTLARAGGVIYRSKKEQTASMPYQFNSNSIMYPPSEVHHQPEKQDLNTTKVNRTTYKSAADMNKIKALKKILQLQPFITPLNQQVSRIAPRNVTDAKQQMKYNLSPFVLNYKSVNYVNNNHNINKYHMQRSFLPYHLPILKPKPTRTSYFHHESHGFDYFDK